MNFMLVVMYRSMQQKAENEKNVCAKQKLKKCVLAVYTAVWPADSRKVLKHLPLPYQDFLSYI